MQDRKLLSKEKHEIVYIKRVARSILKETKNMKANYAIATSQLRRLCKAVIKLK